MRLASIRLVAADIKALGAVSDQVGS